ncbi:GroES-like protein [Rhizoclosmatium globosum]|uniref:GroES-like protein n=1 Tax=Rhizoclosmatium globosum TaxID=329046 RepID=A0A1Y2C9G4_9FUNG|nr:GroES-like protein [Rhizoclosmatium globosum]|eukprot:ORY43680.1 GroES-like protein [Rhizoclosmatium globosum]
MVGVLLSLVHTRFLQRQTLQWAHETAQAAFWLKENDHSNVQHPTHPIQETWPQELISSEIPTPNPGEVVVLVDSAGLNPVDHLIARFGILVTEFPTVMGSDGAGIITAVSPEVTALKVGDRVFFQAFIGRARTSSFQQELKLAAPWTADAVEKNQGKTFLFGVDLLLLVIWLAALAGVKVIVTASPQYHDLLKSIGATHTIDYKAPNVVDQIRALTDGKLTHAFTTAGPGTQATFDSLSTTEESHLVIINPADIQGAESFPNRHVTFGSGSSQDYGLSAALWGFVSQALKDGKIIPQATRVIGGLDKIVAAQEDQIAGKVSSVKLIAKPVLSHLA